GGAVLLRVGRPGNPAVRRPGRLVPGVPEPGDAQRHVADAADDAAELRGAVPAEPAPGHVHGRAPALPRGVLGAVLPAAAVLRSRRGHRVPGAAGPVLRPLARLRPGPAAPRLAGLAQLRVIHRDAGDFAVYRAFS